MTWYAYVGMVEVIAVVLCSLVALIAWYFNIQSFNKIKSIIDRFEVPCVIAMLLTFVLGLCFFIIYNFSGDDKHSSTEFFYTSMAVIYMAPIMLLLFQLAAEFRNKYIIKG